MAGIIYRPKKLRQVKVAVCGLSGDVKENFGATAAGSSRQFAGVGKSWLCSRLMLSDHDKFAEVTQEGEVKAHSSSLTRGEFFTEAVCNDHFLYFGKTMVTLPASESVTAVAAAVAGVGRESQAELHVVEQTEFLDIDNDMKAFRTYGPAHRPYAERAAKRTLEPCCPPKRQYTNYRQVAALSSGATPIAHGLREVSETFPQPFKVDAYAIVYDATLCDGPLYATQKLFLTEVVRALEEKNRIGNSVLVVTKCDEASQRQIATGAETLESIFKLLKISKKIPVVPVSAKEDVNIDALRHILVQCAWSCVDADRISNYHEAVTEDLDKQVKAEKQLEELIIQELEREPLIWANFYFQHYKDKEFLSYLVRKHGLEYVKGRAERFIG